jgi:hypothetical protein
MTNILLRLFDLEIKNKHIIEKKDRSVQNCMDLWRRSNISSKQSYRIRTMRIIKY